MNQQEQTHQDISGKLSAGIAGAAIGAAVGAAAVILADKQKREKLTEMLADVKRKTSDAAEKFKSEARYNLDKVKGDTHELSEKVEKSLEEKKR